MKGYAVRRSPFTLSHPLAYGSSRHLTAINKNQKRHATTGRAIAFALSTVNVRSCLLVLVPTLDGQVFGLHAAEGTDET